MSKLFTDPQKVKSEREKCLQTQQIFILVQCQLHYVPKLLIDPPRLCNQTFELVADNNDFAEPGRMKRRQQINDLSSMVIEDRQQVERFRRFVTRIQPKETALDNNGVEKVQLDKERRFSAIELILQLDTVKIRELAK